MPAVKTKPSRPPRTGGKRADFFGGAIDEVVDRQACLRLTALRADRAYRC